MHGACITVRRSRAANNGIIIENGKLKSVLYLRAARSRLILRFLTATRRRWRCRCRCRRRFRAFANIQMCRNWLAERR